MTKDTPTVESEMILQVFLPKSLVKRLDHWRIEHETTRKDALIKFLSEGLVREEILNSK